MSRRNQVSPPTLGERLHRTLLRLYPEPFRRRFGREVLQIWRLEADQAASHGPVSWLRHWLLWLSTTFGDAFAQRFRDDPSIPLVPEEPPMRISLEQLRRDLAFAWRTLRKRPGWTAAVVGILAIGLGATTAVFSIVHDALLRPLPYEDAESLVVVEGRDPQGQSLVATSMPAFEIYRQQQEGLESVEAWSVIGTTADLGAGPERRRASWTSAGLLDLLGVTPALGRGFEPADDQEGSEPVVIVDYGIWQSQLGGDASALGRRIEIDEIAHTVIGVMPRGFAFPNVEVELWMPLGRAPRQHDYHFLHTLGRLQDGVHRQALQARLANRPLDVPNGYEANGTTAIRLHLVPLHENLVGDLRPQLRIFLAAVLAVLLIACLNVAHLVLTRAIGRRRELAVRAALGAGRPQLIRQLVVETTLLGLLGGALGTLLALAILEGLQLLGPDWMPRPEELGLDPVALAFGIGLATVVGGFLGLLPAIRATGPDASLGVTGARGEVGGRGQGLRSTLIVVQLAGAVTLLATALVLIDGFRTLDAGEAGFETRGVALLDLDLPSGRYGDRDAQDVYYAELLDGLRSLPGVESASMASSHPFTYYLGYPLVVESRSPDDDERLKTLVRLVADDYFPTVGAHLLDGRFVDQRDGDQAVVVNESLASLHYPDGAVGRRIRLGKEESEPWRTIVGVVADVEHYARPATWDSAVYVPFAGVEYPFVMTPLVRVEGEPLALFESIRERMAQVDPRVPLGGMVRLDDMVWDAKSVPRLRTTLLGAFGVVALLLSVVGLYGVMAFWVAERRKEMGVRLALGADRGGILRLVLGRGMGLVALGLALGLALSWPALRLLDSQIAELAPWRIATQGWAVAVLAIAALFACWLPARRAASTDPMTVLRED